MDRHLILIGIVITLVGFFGSILWIAYDSQKNRFPHGMSFVLAAFGCWVLAFPLYLIYRPSMKLWVAAHQHELPPVQKGLSMPWQIAIIGCFSAIAIASFFAHRLVGSDTESPSIQIKTEQDTSMVQPETPNESAITIDPVTGEPVWKGPK